MAEPAHTQPSKGRWYVLLLISVMYLITYLDRVNISTAAPAISKEFGFDKITMGIIFSAFVWAYAAFQVPGGWLSDRLGPRRVLAGVVGYWSIMTAATAAGVRLRVVYRCPFPVRRWRSRRLSGRNARDAAVVSAPRARPGTGCDAQCQPARSRDRAADRRPDHEPFRLALGILHLRRGRPAVVGLVVFHAIAICRKSIPW